MTLTQFHVAQVSNYREFLEETVRLGCDYSSMGFPLGMLADSIDEQQAEVRKLTGTSRTMFAVYDGDALM